MNARQQRGGQQPDQAEGEQGSKHAGDLSGPRRLSHDQRCWLVDDKAGSGFRFRVSGKSKAEPKVGSRKSEVGSRKSEVGSRKSEVGSRKSEVGSRKNRFRILRRLTTDHCFAGNRNPETRNRGFQCPYVLGRVNRSISGAAMFISSTANATPSG